MTCLLCIQSAESLYLGCRLYFESRLLEDFCGGDGEAVPTVETEGMCTFCKWKVGRLRLATVSQRCLSLSSTQYFSIKSVLNLPELDLRSSFQCTLVLWIF